MSITQSLKRLYLGHLSKPKSDRVIYRNILKQGAGSIVELGMGSLQRTLNLIELAQVSSGAAKIRYTAIDLFDSRPADMPELKLIQTHRELCKTGAQVKLMPGDESVLGQIANSLTNSDLILISSCSDIQSQSQLLFYLPRMVHENSLILQQQTLESGGRKWRAIDSAKLKLGKEQLNRQAA